MTIGGCLPVLCTPFRSDGAIDVDDFDALIDFVGDCGVQGCVYPGVASEVDTLSDAERSQMVGHLGRRLGGRLPFVVGASAATADEVVAHIRDGAEAGAAAAMVMAPADFGSDVAAQTAFFDAISRDAALPIIMQNAPRPIGAGLLPEITAEIARAVSGIRWVKEESMPCGQNLTRIVKAAGGAIEGVFGGAGGRYITDELARGSLGTLPAAELADLHVRLVAAWGAGDIDEARRLFEVSMPLLNFQAIFRMHMSKEVLRRRGVLRHTHVRGAGPRMDDGDRAELSALIERIAPELDRYPVVAREAAE